MSSRKSTAQAAIEELRVTKDRCARYAEDLRISERHAEDCRKEALSAIQDAAKHGAQAEQLRAELAIARKALDYSRTIMSDAAEVIGTRFITDENGVVLPAQPTASTLLALVLALNNGVGKCRAALLGRGE